jgi:hypothetical protein
MLFGISNLTVNLIFRYLPLFLICSEKEASLEVRVDADILCSLIRVIKRARDVFVVAFTVS